MACPFDGELTLETDTSLTVADFADALSLPSIPFKLVKRAIDKIKMRQILQKKKTNSFLHYLFQGIGWLRGT
jgi:hypothetical protein